MQKESHLTYTQRSPVNDHIVQRQQNVTQHSDIRQSTESDHARQNDQTGHQPFSKLPILFDAFQTSCKRSRRRCSHWPCRWTSRRFQGDGSPSKFQIRSHSQARSTRPRTKPAKSSMRCKYGSSARKSSRRSINASKRLPSCNSKRRGSRRGKQTFVNLLCLQTHENETLS